MSNGQRGGPLAKLAAIWCGDATFQKWAKASDATAAAEFIYRVCNIKSRAELDHNQSAARIFHRDIRWPFMEYQARQ